MDPRGFYPFCCHSAYKFDALNLQELGAFGRIDSPILNQQFYPALGSSERGFPESGPSKLFFFESIRQLGDCDPGDLLSFRRNYGTFIGAYLYLRSISAARGRSLFWTGLISIACSAALAWLARHGLACLHVD